MILNRVLSNQNGLFGEMVLPSGIKLYTLERNWNNNQANISCIPSGNYDCAIVQSPRFGLVYRVKNVPNRSHILIHAGNSIKDTQGCILVGLSHDDSWLYDSKKALKILMAQMIPQSFNLLILDKTDANYSQIYL